MEETVGLWEEGGCTRSQKLKEAPNDTSHITGLTGEARVVTADAVEGVSKFKGLNSFALGSSLNLRIALLTRNQLKAVCVHTQAANATHSSFLLGSDVGCALSSSLSSGMEEGVE